VTGLGRVANVSTPAPTSGLGSLRPHTDRRVAALLDPNERAVLVVHPHWWRLIGASGGGLVGLVVAALLLGLGPFGPARVLAMVVGLASVGWILVGTARWYFEVLVLTDRRVVFARGVIARRTDEIPLKHVNDVRTEQGVLGRLLNFGRVRIESGNARGEELVTFIPSPERVRQALSTLALESEQSSGAEPATPGPARNPSGFVAELERLSVLRMAGMLTDEEFERAKARILSTGGSGPEGDAQR
jgi:membrane protein YdbS with pleckstrin-like domain